MTTMLADLVDDVDYALCEVCAFAYAMRDGWDDLCPECCAVLDDHDSGLHRELAPHSCRACDAEETDFALQLPATA